MREGLRGSRKTCAVHEVPGEPVRACVNVKAARNGGWWCVRDGLRGSHKMGAMLVKVKVSCFFNQSGEGHAALTHSIGQTVI